MVIDDFYPIQGYVHPGQDAVFRVILEVRQTGPVEFALRIFDLRGQCGEQHSTIELTPGQQSVEISWRSPERSPAGYAAQMTASAPGQASASASTAFDVLPDWRTFPRYGFLTNFSASRRDLEWTVEYLARYHVNGLQFYDWQYRHDQLLAPEQEYSDPLGRQLSLETIRRLVDTAHRHNLAAMPYLAVYAASAAFWREHPDWALYDEKGRPVAFGEDFLGLMDPSLGRPWALHLLRECGRALENIPFDGLHIDQYGDPKEAWDSSGEPVNLPAAFGDFIRSARERFPGKTVLFNAVGNWPIDVLAASPEHFEYIEVWPPKTGLLDLREIVQGARKLSGGRPVVIALYLPADRPANVLLADALIFSSGGSRIELGEGAQLLADPYFPKHQLIPEDLRRDLRRLYDFAVRYEEWIGPFVADAPELQVDAPAEVCWVARQSLAATVVSLVNLAGLGPAPRWDEALPVLTALRDVPVSIAAPHQPKRVLSAGPEAPIESAPLELDFSYSPGWISLTLPDLDLWRVIAIEW